MSSWSNVGPLTSQNYLYPAASGQKPAAPSNPSAEESPAEPADVVDIGSITRNEVMETGRIALLNQSGNLTSDQASQLYQQLAAIQAQIKADEQANGGTLTDENKQAIAQSQNQLSAAIYSDAHGGAAPPATPQAAGAADKRAAAQAGRILLNEKAGNLSADQVTQLAATETQIDNTILADKQANGGTLTAAQAYTINQMQSAASKTIYDEAHPPVDSIPSA